MNEKVLDRQQLIEQRLRVAFPRLEKLVITDESEDHRGHVGAQGGASHFALLLTTPDFTGLPLLQRHQQIYALLSDLIPNQVHALKITAKAPLE